MDILLCIKICYNIPLCLIQGDRKENEMKFRPCIDIHNGVVKQIVGASLADNDQGVDTNFTSSYGADYYAKLYQKDRLSGGHVILLNPNSSPYYEATRQQAFQALAAYPQGLQVGGGITADNAAEYLTQGASHVIVTSFVFRDGVIRWDALEQLKKRIGKQHLVLDLSCKKKEETYVIVTNRWQNTTNVEITYQLLDQLTEYCDEFLIHGVDVEGKAKGVERELVQLLGEYQGIPITYAGGIGTLKDLEEFQIWSQNKMDFTIGSALDLFGGQIPYGTIKSL